MRKKILIRFLKMTFFSAFPGLSIFLFISDGISDSTPRLSHDQIEIIESNLSREKQKLKKFDSREKDLLRQISSLEQEIDQKRKTLDALDERIRAHNIEIEKFAQKQAYLKQLLNDSESKAARRLVALYKYARKGYIKTLANVIDFDQLWQRLIYLKAISEEDRKALKRLSEECLEYKISISHLEEQIARKVSLEKKEKLRLLTLREELEEKVIRLMKIHREKEFYETAVKELQLASLDLKRTISAIEDKKAQSTTWSSQFEKAKNKLPFPLEGKVIRRDKLLGSQEASFNKGIFIEGSDTEVKAIYPGRVDFSGRLKGYGEIVIINHGSRFFTISAQLSQRTREEGEKVKSGDVVGLVGHNGTTKKSTVYFEIRKAGKSLDPLNWLKTN